MNKKDKALVVFSGGQDSTTLLYWAKNRYNYVEAITFNYGQKHQIEIELSKYICERENIKQTIIDLSFLNTIVESALITNGNVSIFNDKGLPSSFVPNRNQLFITLSHSYLQKIGGGELILGVCQNDFNGYADCRKEYIDAIEIATNLGSNENIKIITPLMFLDKSETFELAEKENCLDKIINYSHTCYEGKRLKFDWGYGCGECSACKSRELGYKNYKNKK